MILYEPAVAEKLNELSCGSDSISIKYPSVNTCLTLTYVYPNVLVGAHFGMKDAHMEWITTGEVIFTLGLMNTKAPTDAPIHALLIGNKVMWSDEERYPQLADALSIIRQDIANRTEHITEKTGHYFGYNEPQYETGEYSGGTVDIEIFHYGLITIRSVDGNDVNTYNFREGYGGLSSAARGRLGL